MSISRFTHICGCVCGLAPLSLQLFSGIRSIVVWLHKTTQRMLEDLVCKADALLSSLAVAERAEQGSALSELDLEFSMRTLS